MVTAATGASSSKSAIAATAAASPIRAVEATTIVSATGPAAELLQRRLFHYYAVPLSRKSFQVIIPKLMRIVTI